MSYRPALEFNQQVIRFIEQNPGSDYLQVAKHFNIRPNHSTAVLFQLAKNGHVQRRPLDFRLRYYPANYRIPHPEDPSKSNGEIKTRTWGVGKHKGLPYETRGKVNEYVKNKYPAPVTPWEVADEFDLSGTVSHYHLKMLEREGLVERLSQGRYRAKNQGQIVPYTPPAPQQEQPKSNPPTSDIKRLAQEFAWESGASDFDTMKRFVRWVEGRKGP